MIHEDVAKVSRAAMAKVSLFKNHFGKYFMRAIMAGFFIIAAMIFSNVVGSIFSTEHPVIGKFLSACVFALAVLLICMIGGELFTGNNFVMAFGAFDKKVKWADVLKIWGISYIGNFIGCVILGLVFVLAGAAGTADYYAAFIPGKLALPTGVMFFKAILCNFFVCLGVLCNIKLREESAKIVMTILCIAAFVISGFEHCIANMGNFFVAYLLVPNLSLTAMLRSMVIVTLGNIVGGALFLAWPLRIMSMDQ